MAGEVEELRIHLLEVCWKMEEASQSWKAYGLGLELVGGASLCCEQRKRAEGVLSDWELGERCRGFLC